MMNIDIPKKIKIAGFDYKIRMDKEADKDLQSMNWLGSQSCNRQLIQVHSDQSPQQMSNTFLHEIIHAVNGLYNNNKMDEDGVNQLANGMHQVFEELGIRFVR
jgi:hypothetical protein